MNTFEKWSIAFFYSIFANFCSTLIIFGTKIQK